MGNADGRRDLTLCEPSSEASLTQLVAHNDQGTLRQALASIEPTFPGHH
jgi:hypothetical protein